MALIDNEIFTGVTDDPRLDPRVINGWNINEVVAESSYFNWSKKSVLNLVKYPVWDQSSTSACVAFSKAKQVSIKIFLMTGVWIDFSPASIYQLRPDKTRGGMAIADANDIVNNTGVTLEALMKSQGLTEEQIQIVHRSKVADLFAKAIAEAVVRYLYIPINIDKIAQTIEAGKAVSMLIFSNYDEYARMVPIVIDTNLTYENAPIRHEIVGVDYFLDQNGIKRIYVNDSAHFGGLAVRELTEDFIMKRCILADALDVFTFDIEIGDKPSYDGTIISLQKCLLYEGLFPVGISFVENLGPVTREAINKFQIKYGLSTTGTGTVGPKTTEKLKILYP